jgi:glycosyltransferase involved in cell wall biosynthesis
VKISATVICLNEEDHIGELLETIRWVDEIVVVDSGSADKTIEIASRFTSKIFQKDFESFLDQHRFADSKTTHDWLLWVDADERVSPEMRAAIEALSKRTDAELPEGFRFARRTWYLGKWIKHSGWYPDRQMRLYRKAASFWDGMAPHETARVRGTVEDADGEILHFTKRDLAHHHRAIDNFTSQAAKAIVKKGRVKSAVSIFFSVFAAFLRSFVIKLGFLDGIQGLFIAFFTAYGVFLKHAKAWELKSNPARRPLSTETRLKLDENIAAATQPDTADIERNEPGIV